MATKKRWRKSGKRIRISGKRSYAAQCCCATTCDQCVALLRGVRLQLSGFQDFTCTFACNTSTFAFGNFTWAFLCSILNGTWDLTEPIAGGFKLTIAAGTCVDKGTLARDDTGCTGKFDHLLYQNKLYLISLTARVSCSGNNITISVSFDVVGLSFIGGACSVSQVTDNLSCGVSASGTLGTTRYDSVTLTGSWPTFCSGSLSGTAAQSGCNVGSPTFGSVIGIVSPLF